MIVSLVGDATLERYKAVLQLRSAGVTIITPAIGQSLDDDSPTQRLASKGAVLSSSLDGTDGTGSFLIAKWKFDIKAMRKMKAGDRITLSEITDSSGSNVVVVGDIDLWFKE